LTTERPSLGQAALELGATPRLFFYGTGLRSRFYETVSEIYGQNQIWLNLIL
jgi:hypothetical protein